MNRKVVNVSHGRDWIVALCDDGTLWQKWVTTTSDEKWEEIAPPPQTPSAHPVPLEQTKSYGAEKAIP